MTFIKYAQSLATTARDRRLAGDHHHGANSEFPLVGYCFDNAYVSHHVFTAAGMESHVIAGTTERVADDLIEAGISPRNCESVSDLAGHVHYWLRVGSGDNTAVVDIASDSFETLGVCLVEPTLPGDYIALPDSQREGTETLAMVEKEGRRCRFCGDHRYTHGGCPECHQTVSSDLNQ